MTSHGRNYFMAIFIFHIFFPSRVYRSARNDFLQSDNLQTLRTFSGFSWGKRINYFFINVLVFLFLITMPVDPRITEKRGFAKSNLLTDFNQVLLYMKFVCYTNSQKSATKLAKGFLRTHFREFRSQVPPNSITSDFLKIRTVSCHRIC